MSSDNEEGDLNYGIEDEFGKAFESDQVERSEKERNIEYPDEEAEYRLEDGQSERAAKKPNEAEDDGEEECGLEDLLDLIEKEDEEPEQAAKEEAAKKPKPVAKLKEDDSFISSLDTSLDKRKSSITITKISSKTKEQPGGSETADHHITEKYTGARLVKSSFRSTTELQTRLACDYGKFYKLIDLKRHAPELKDNKDPNALWFTVFVLSSKTETKSSAKGNNYVIWRISDINSIDKEHDISLFLFGNAYKTHWKASEFEVFALCKPEFLADNNNQQGGGGGGGNSNAYFNGANHVLGKKPVLSNNWNKFASKKVVNNLQVKFAMSIKAEYQLVPLGHSKDITTCQSYKQATANIKSEYMGEAPKRCKSLVNLQQAPYCVFHCKQLDKNKGKDGGFGGKYSMASPSAQRSAATLTTRFGSEGLFPASAPDVQFHSLHAGFSSLKKQMEDKEERLKALKEIQTERLLSLNSSISQVSTSAGGVLSNVAYKTNKKSDQELMASLEGKQLSAEEIKAIRLEQQATIRHNNQLDTSEQKELSKIFNCKALVTSEKTVFTSVSSLKLNELRRAQVDTLKNGPDGVSPAEYSDAIRQRYEDKKKNCGLSTLGSHREIVKQVKDKKKQDEAEGKGKSAHEFKPEDLNFAETLEQGMALKPQIVASDFLKKTVSEALAAKQALHAKPKPAPAKKAADDFDLELFDGDSLVSKKLNDSPSLSAQPPPMTAYQRKIKEILERSANNNSKSSQPKLTNARPSTSALSASPARVCQPVKRQASPSLANESAEERREKKLKAIDEILNIKSNHAKEANSIDKNPHMKAYFDRLEVQESIDDKLSSTTRREVNAVTCATCSYTSFSQSEYCRNQKHVVKRHMAIQRYFKCKRCNNRTYTLDKVCPTTGCAQCGFEKFEPCGMKSAICDPVERSTALDLDSDLLALS